MIISRIIGGLGNQMFQYAMGYSIAQKTKQTLKLDIFDYSNYEERKFELDSFNIKYIVATKDEIKKLKYKELNMIEKILVFFNKSLLQCSSSCYQEQYFQYNRKVVNIKQDVYFSGYWQSEKYFIDFRKDILKMFSLKRELSVGSKYYLNKIKNTEAISIHIRRGDYVFNSEANSFHGLCSLEYYKKAVDIITAKMLSTCFFIFSDDLEWVQKHFEFIGEDKYFVELDKNTPDVEEMYLMSQCKHNIIANSSFSWWGAWLNENQKKIVIAPKQWFSDSSINVSDLTPDTWIKI